MSVTAKQIPPLIQKFTDADGNPLAGGLVWTYQAGTTILQETYTDATGDTPNENPIVLDSTGACEIWITDGFYKFVVTDSLGNPQFTVDNVAPAIDATAVAEAAAYAAQAAALFGPGNISPTAFTIANNQSSASDVTGLLFDHTVVGSFQINYWIKRLTTGSGATALSETGTLYGIYDLNSSTWKLMPGPQGPDDSGVDLSITAAGQVQYTSTNITGTASVSKMTFQAMTLGV